MHCIYNYIFILQLLNNNSIPFDIGKTCVHNMLNLCTGTRNRKNDV